MSRREEARALAAEVMVRAFIRIGRHDVHGYALARAMGYSCHMAEHEAAQWFEVSTQDLAALIKAARRNLGPDLAGRAE